MTSIVGKFVQELADQLAEKGVSIVVLPGAVRYLAEKGYDPDFGARPLDRLVQNELKRPLGDELLFGRLEHGGCVEVDVERDGTRLRFAYPLEPRPVVALGEPLG
jgi:ATP-dependent Clp protease ATP-binding subunit ClpA